MVAHVQVVVVGGGYIGVELAGILRALGSQVHRVCVPLAHKYTESLPGTQSLRAPCAVAEDSPIR